MALSINANLFVAGGTDSSGYISAAELWRRGEIYRPESIPFWATWVNAADTVSPVGYRRGPIPGTEVQIYPIGFPLLLAAATLLAGAIGAHLVAPVMGGILVWCTFALARQVGGAFAGLIAAALVAASPITILHTVDAMSDVPAAACWAAAWVLVMRRTVSASASSGLVAGLAVLIRPNLAPLLVIPLAILFFGIARGPEDKGHRCRACAAFIAAAAPGPVLILWSQFALYGNAFTPGYVEHESFFALDRIAPNAVMYLRLLASTHTPLPLLGLAAVPMVLSPRLSDGLPPNARLIVLSAFAFVLGNYLLYLPYLSLDHWPFLRFLLPGLVALFILFAGVMAYATRRLFARARWLGAALPLIVAVVVLQSAPLLRYAGNEWRTQTRVRVMGNYLREALPAKAAVLSFVHSGAIAHYTGRDVVRLDLLEPQTLDRIVADLSRHDFQPVLVLDQALEFAAFQQRFATSRFGRLDWPPRATFTSGTSIWLLTTEDFERHQRGERWPTDVLR